MVNGLYISGRQRKLLTILLEADQKVTVTKIAETLDISERTVHRDLKSLNELRVNFNLTIKKKTGVGLDASIGSWTHLS